MSSTDGSFLKAGKRGKRRQDEATHRFDDESMELRKAVSFCCPDSGKFQRLNAFRVCPHTRTHISCQGATPPLPSGMKVNEESTTTTPYSEKGTSRKRHLFCPALRKNPRTSRPTPQSEAGLCRCTTNTNPRKRVRNRATDVARDMDNTHTQDLAIESTHRWIVHDPNSDLPTKNRRWWNTRVTSLDGRAIDTAQKRPSLREGNSTPHFHAVPTHG